MPTCKGCKADNHPAYDKRYGGYCLDCHNAGVPERDDQTSELTEQRDELLALVKDYIDYEYRNEGVTGLRKRMRAAIARCEKEPG